MKKIFNILGAIFILFLLTSTATAVPQANSMPLMKIVKELEQNKTFLIEKIRYFR